MIQINADNLNNKYLSVADILDDYASKLDQSDEIATGKMSLEEYITLISALRFAISVLRGGNKQ